MTKKHFEMIAYILGISHGKHEVEKHLCSYFQAENPKFDVKRFKRRIREIEFPGQFKSERS